jgi:hypothetical protein
MVKGIRYSSVLLKIRTVFLTLFSSCAASGGMEIILKPGMQRNGRLQRHDDKGVSLFIVVTHQDAVERNIKLEIIQTGLATSPMSRLLQMRSVAW